MYYLITYKNSVYGANNWRYKNEVTTLSPAKWLVSKIKEWDNSETILLFAIKISKEDYAQAVFNL